MPRIKLIDAISRAMQPPAHGQVNYIDVTLPGFSLRVAAGGAKTWTVTYHRGARVRRGCREGSAEEKGSRHAFSLEGREDSPSVAGAVPVGRRARRSSERWTGGERV